MNQFSDIYAKILVNLTISLVRLCFMYFCILGSKVCHVFMYIFYFFNRNCIHFFQEIHHFTSLLCWGIKVVYCLLVFFHYIQSSHLYLQSRLIYSDDTIVLETVQYTINFLEIKLISIITHLSTSLSFLQPDTHICTCT